MIVQYRIYFVVLWVVAFLSATVESFPYIYGGVSGVFLSLSLSFLLRLLCGFKLISLFCLAFILIYSLLILCHVHFFLHCLDSSLVLFWCDPFYFGALHLLFCRLSEYSHTHTHTRNQIIRNHKQIMVIYSNEMFCRFVCESFPNERH